MLRSPSTSYWISQCSPSGPLLLLVPLLLHLPQLGPIHTPSFEEQAQGEEDQFHANNSEDDAEMESEAVLQVGPISDDLEALVDDPTSVDWSQPWNMYLTSTLCRNGVHRRNR